MRTNLQVTLWRPYALLAKCIVPFLGGIYMLRSGTSCCCCCCQNAWQVHGPEDVSKQFVKLSTLPLKWAIEIFLNIMDTALEYQTRGFKLVPTRELGGRMLSAHMLIHLQAGTRMHVRKLK